MRFACRRMRPHIRKPFTNTRGACSARNMTSRVSDSGGDIFDSAPLRAVLRREVRGSISSRYFQVFCVIALAGGFAAIAFAEEASAAHLFLLQLSLYCVSLFALLLGVNS